MSRGDWRRERSQVPIDSLRGCSVLREVGSKDQLNCIRSIHTDHTMSRVDWRRELSRVPADSLRGWSVLREVGRRERSQVPIDSLRGCSVLREVGRRERSQGPIDSLRGCSVLREVGRRERSQGPIDSLRGCSVLREVGLRVTIAQCVSVNQWVDLYFFLGKTTHNATAVPLKARRASMDRGWLPLLVRLRRCVSGRSCSVYGMNVTVRPISASKPLNLHDAHSGDRAQKLTQSLLSVRSIT